MEELILKEYTDEELEEILFDNTIKYYTIIKSEKEAKEVLKQYKQEYFDQNKTFKAYYLDFSKAVQKRHIFIPKEVRDVEITDEDVLERLYESKECYIALIYRHANNYYGYLGNGVYDNDKNTSFDENTGANIRVKEIEDIYEEIVSNYEQVKNISK